MTYAQGLLLDLEAASFFFAHRRTQCSWCRLGVVSGVGSTDAESLDLTGFEVFGCRKCTFFIF